MFTAKEKNVYVSVAVSIVKWGVLNPNCKYEDYFPISEIENGRDLSIVERGSNESLEELFGDWKKTIKVYRNEKEDNHSPEVEYDEEWLGQYSPMSSPGVIILDLNNMREALKRHIQDLISTCYPVTYSDFDNLVSIFIRKTVYHEYFHHYTDIQRQLYGSYYIKDTEEALAVAWSRMKTEWYCKNKKYWKSPIDSPLYAKFRKDIYNYWQPGYKDWGKYYDPITDEKSVFCDNVRTYTMPSGSSKLLSNGVVFDRLILENLDAIYQTSDAVTLNFRLV